MSVLQERDEHRTLLMPVSTTGAPASSSTTAKADEEREGVTVVHISLLSCLHFTRVGLVVCGYILATVGYLCSDKSDDIANNWIQAFALVLHLAVSTGYGYCWSKGISYDPAPAAVILGVCAMAMLQAASTTMS
jgi:hypothetical protein